MVCAGIDIGSVTTKAVILERDKILAKALVPTGAEPKKSAEKALDIALKEAGLTKNDLQSIVSTGYGRRTVDFSNSTVTEISCAAKGVIFLGSHMGKIQTIIDLGGQDSKVISLDETGKIVDFVMNDRCAAGTGRFLEVMSNILEVNLEDFGNLALKSNTSLKISSVCTVFAESEVISLIAQGKNKEDIIAGVCSAIAERIYKMVLQVGVKEIISFVGGGANNIGIKKAIEDKLKTKIWVPQEPQFVVALGAALFAQRTKNVDLDRTKDIV